MDNSVEFQINIAGNVFVGVGKLQGEFNQLVNVVGQVDKSINSTVNNVNEKLANINLTSIMTQIKEVSQGIASLSQPGIEFGQSMADLSSLTGIVGNDLERLGKIARKTGRESGLGAKAAAEALTIIASQKPVDEIGMDGLIELQDKAITLSHAAGMAMNEASTALAGTINQFGFEATEANRVINVLAAGSKFGAADINDLAESFKVVGSQSAIAGVSLEETAGVLEVLSKNNVKGAEAGTKLRNIILSLQTVFGADLGKMSVSEALDQLKPKMQDATFMSQSFGRESMAAAQFLIKNSEAVAEMTDKLTGTDTAYEQAAIRTNTVAMMMERCRATIDNLKIGLFELTGEFGGYTAIVFEQLGSLSQLAPLFYLIGKGVGALSKAIKTGTLLTSIWTKVQWLFNAALWANPITWIVIGIMALIAVIVVCVTKVQGWGAQWKSVVNFMKLTGQLFVKTFKFEFQTMVNGIMLGLDYIKLGWYKFKSAVGIGDSAENDAMIAKIRGDIDSRKTEIVEGAKELADLAKQASGALTWELSWKKKDKSKDEAGDGQPIAGGFMPEMSALDLTGMDSGLELNLNGKGGRKGTGSGSGGGSSSLDLNKLIPDLKGTTSYSAIASRLSSFRTSAITAAAAVALPLAVAGTTLPNTSNPALNPNRTEYMAGKGRQTVSMSKFCDQFEIHIANADGKGYDQIRAEVTKVLKEIFDDYGTEV